jgi:hypothetical protein
LKHRISANTELNPQILQILQDVLYRKHPSVQKFKQAYEQWKDIPNTHEFKIALRFDKACDKRRYNLPSAGVDEVAVILPGDGDQELYQRDIILFFRGGGLWLINKMSPMYHSLHFVLLFPTGQLGWHPKLIFGDPNESEDD